MDKVLATPKGIYSVPTLKREVITERKVIPLGITKDRLLKAKAIKY